MAGIFRRVTRGESSRRSAREPDLDETITDHGYGFVQFVSDAQKERFVSLLPRAQEMLPTRFIDRDALTTLGLKTPLKRMLKRSGCPGLYKMNERSYRCITLEFLSSFVYNEADRTISFRLFNYAQCFTLDTWGTLLGCRSTGLTDLSRLRDVTGILWKALTGRNRGGSNWRFRLNLIHHPVIRLWCRLLGSTYFARSEANNMKFHEIAILASYLNIDRGERFEVNIAHFVALHFELIASGAISPIMIGGLVTVIAKKLFNGITEARLELVPGDNDDVPPMMDIAYMTRLYYLKAVDHFSWWWKVNGVRLLSLPITDDEDQLRPVLSLPEGGNDLIDYDYYLLVPAADRQRHAPIDEDDAPNVGVNLIDPIGDYSRFQHYPFQRGPYQPDGYDPMRFPPTYASHPPFAEPAVWNQNSRDSMQMGLCNQMHQLGLDQSLALHNMYASFDRGGFFPPGTQHPHFYVPQPDPPQMTQNDPAPPPFFPFADHQGDPVDRRESYFGEPSAPHAYREVSDSLDGGEEENAAVADDSEEDSYYTDSNSPKL